MHWKWKSLFFLERDSSQATNTTPRESTQVKSHINTGKSGIGWDALIKHKRTIQKRSNMSAKSNLVAHKQICTREKHTNAQRIKKDPVVPIQEGHTTGLGWCSGLACWLRDYGNDISIGVKQQMTKKQAQGLVAFKYIDTLKCFQEVLVSHWSSLFKLWVIRQVRNGLGSCFYLGWVELNKSASRYP